MTRHRSIDMEVYYAIKNIIKRGKLSPAAFAARVFFLVFCMFSMFSCFGIMCNYQMEIEDKADETGKAVSIRNGKPFTKGAAMDFIASLPAGIRTRLHTVILERKSDLMVPFMYYDDRPQFHTEWEQNSMENGTILEGRFFSETEFESASRVAVFPTTSGSMCEKYDYDPGTETIRVDEITYDVVGHSPLFLIPVTAIPDETEFDQMVVTINMNFTRTMFQDFKEHAEQWFPDHTVFEPDFALSEDTRLFKRIMRQMVLVIFSLAVCMLALLYYDIQKNNQRNLVYLQCGLEKRRLAMLVFWEWILQLIPAGSIAILLSVSTKKTFGIVYPYIVQALDFKAYAAVSGVFLLVVVFFGDLCVHSVRLCKNG